MLLSEFLDDNPVKKKQLKLSTGNRCENCSFEFPLPSLAVHLIDNPPDIDETRDPSKHVLILCPRCLRSFASGKVDESMQRELVRYRPASVRKAMRAVLGYRPRIYTPPDVDLAAIFAEVCGSSAIDLCLNGG